MTRTNNRHRGGLPKILTIILLALPTLSHANASTIPTVESAPYTSLITLTERFFAWKEERRNPLQQSAAHTADQLRQLKMFQEQLAVISPAEWEPAKQVDYLALRSAMDQHDFLLQVSKPWERDPGYYVDRMQWLTFTELPVSGADLTQLQADLRATVSLVDLAKHNLNNVPTDLAVLAIHNLTQPDGVGHGHPFRSTPPAGVIGWYADLRQRAQISQPVLLDQIESAQAAVQDLHQWLVKNQGQMTAAAGVGQELLDWYLMQVKFMPYSSDDIEALAERELDRTWAFYALEQHRNRSLPELTLPASQQEYEARIASVDRDIRNFIKTEKFITIPDHIPDDFREIGFNVPWIKRNGGPNYWEQIQYRDPSPDHWHAHTPGHKVDAKMLATITHPIRKHFRDGGRMEGWALYLEEVPLQLGFYENRPRTRELIYNFGIFRAARTLGDLRLQRNEISIPEAVAFWRAKTPWLDGDVARVDAEIYLRRPPGYGLGYTVGSFQMYKLLADRKQQLGDQFVLGEFHDHVMAAGGIPFALIRYEMTGFDDEVSQFWKHQSLDQKLAELQRQ